MLEYIPHHVNCPFCRPVGPRMRPSYSSVISSLMVLGDFCSAKGMQYKSWAAEFSVRYGVEDIIEIQTCSDTSSSPVPLG